MINGHMGYIYAYGLWIHFSCFVRIRFEPSKYLVSCIERLQYSKCGPVFSMYYVYIIYNILQYRFCYSMQDKTLQFWSCIETERERERGRVSRNRVKTNDESVWWRKTLIFKDQQFNKCQTYRTIFWREFLWSLFWL